MKQSMQARGAVGERIYALRLELGWSQSQLARRAGVARATIGELESGQNALPAADTLLRLADALAADPWVIVEGRARECPPDTATPLGELFQLFAAMPPLYQDLLLRFAREMTSGMPRQALTVPRKSPKARAPKDR